MGFSILNPGNQAANATLSVFNNSGVLTAEKQVSLPPLHRLTDLLSGDMLFGSGFSQMGGHIKLVSDHPLVSVAIYGDYREGTFPRLKASWEKLKQPRLQLNWKDPWLKWKLKWQQLKWNNCGPAPRGAAPRGTRFKIQESRFKSQESRLGEQIQ